MYTGTIHATMTLTGGELVGLNWIAAEGHSTGARCLRYDVLVGPDPITSLLPIYIRIRCEASLKGSDRKRHQTVLEDWLMIYPRKCGTSKDTVNN